MTTCARSPARVEERAAELDAFGLPMSIDHGDLHAGNVLAPGDRYVFFDWHEGAVTHPFFSMVVATRWLHHHHAVEAGSPRRRACTRPTSPRGPSSAR